MPHAVLLGDSVFDNGVYVPGRPAVDQQLRTLLGEQWQVTLLAVDGAVTSHVASQLQQLPRDATHLVISAGGNDALPYSPLVQQQQMSARAAFDELGAVQAEFRRKYTAMLKEVTSRRLPTMVCTIYDSVSFVGLREKAGLSAFNDVIISCAVAARCPVLDLRPICNQAADYSDVSPIEPSEQGGQKIAQAIRQILLTHDFARQETVVFG